MTNKSKQTSHSSCNAAKEFNYLFNNPQKSITRKILQSIMHKCVYLCLIISMLMNDEKRVERVNNLERIARMS